MPERKEQNLGEPQPEQELSPEGGKENRPQEEGLDHMTNEDLCYMIGAGLDDSETEQAWQELLRRGPTNEDLRQLIGPGKDYTPLSIVKQAARKLLEREPPNKDLCRIIVAEADQSIAEEAWQKLSERGPTNKDLCHIISSDVFSYQAPPSIKKQASQELLKREPPNDDLCCIIVANAGQPIAEEAWQKLSERGPTNKDLCHIIGAKGGHFVDQSIAEQAWQELLRRGPTDDDLWDIINSSRVPPSIEEQAQKLYYLGEAQPEQELSPEEKKEREIQESALGYLNKLSEKLENKREKTKDKLEKRLLQEKIKRLDLFMGQVQRREYFSVEVEGHKSDSVYDFFEKVYKEGKKEGKELKEIKEIIDGLNLDYIREKFDREKRDILEKSFRQYLIEEGEIKEEEYEEPDTHFPEEPEEEEAEPEIEAEGILGEKAIQEILNNPDVTKETDPEKRKEKIAYYIFQERIKQGKGVAHLDNRFGKFNENSAKAYRDWDWYNAAMLLEREKKESRPISGPKTESEPIPISKPEPPPEPSIEPTPEPTEEPPKPEPVELPEEPEKKGKKRKGKTWGFIKERLKGFFTIGFWEFHQAEKFRSVTRKVGKKIAKQERLLKKKEELKESSKKELEKMGLSGPVLEQALSQIEDKRIKDNERVVDLIVKNAREKLEKKLAKYRDQYGNKIVGEKIDRAVEKLREKLLNETNNQVERDKKYYKKFLRESLDPKYWKRYIYGGLETSLWAAGIIVVPSSPAAKVGTEVLAGVGRFSKEAIQQGKEMVNLTGEKIKMATESGAESLIQAKEVAIKEGGVLWEAAKNLIIKSWNHIPTSEEIGRVARGLLSDNNIEKVITVGGLLFIGKTTLKAIRGIFRRRK